MKIKVKNWFKNLKFLSLLKARNYFVNVVFLVGLRYFCISLVMELSSWTFLIMSVNNSSCVLSVGLCRRMYNISFQHRNVQLESSITRECTSGLVTYYDFTISFYITPIQSIELKILSHLGLGVGWILKLFKLLY
jgi:hypothetical protein